MAIAIGMQHIVDEIKDSKTQRFAEVQEIKKSVKMSITEFNATRNHDAIEMHRSLRRMVKSIERDSNDMINNFHMVRIAMARETQDVLEEFTKKLKQDVTEIRLDAHNIVHGFADERVSRGIELSRMLKIYNDGIAPEVLLLRDQFKQERAIVKKDLVEAQQIWKNYIGMEDVKKKNLGINETFNPGVKKSENIPDENLRDIQTNDIEGIPDENLRDIQTNDIGDISDENARDIQTNDIGDIPDENISDSEGDDFNAPYYNELKEKILEVIKDSPSGISLTKAKKIIGADKRKIYRVVNELLETGLIQKNGTNYILRET